MSSGSEHFVKISKWGRGEYEGGGKTRGGLYTNNYTFNTLIQINMGGTYVTFVE